MAMVNSDSRGASVDVEIVESVEDRRSQKTRAKGVFGEGVALMGKKGLVVLPRWAGQADGWRRRPQSGGSSQPLPDVGRFGLRYCTLSSGLFK